MKNLKNEILKNEIYKDLLSEVSEEDKKNLEETIKIFAERFQKFLTKKSKENKK